ncbi:bifunctional transcriptional activator/DNA repair enzyme protein Ada [Asaia sp. W19]|uniref:bifunctional transcriptional activator/DNA repair enzyme AdaA n=1 Tax=unclassified Asaia TaxID=2685023 RepID=UPI000F8ED2E1|nr:trifunctional transcriptional activator/DNA repair protein Ada/methylated-DNA--[protein]-cysteine S-methyltransferase [Asaia sp. W19]RUT26646.1 bifunctional transcriptional activator/DNA repair enzyme protein Ada [Asaia sp. W19]
MLFDLPSHETLYEALLARDARYDGRVYVCVGTTGIFCRLTCPARKPLATNCSFRDSVRGCIEAGFRPCKRCHPLQGGASHDPLIAQLLDSLDADPGRRWSERDLVALGLDPSTVRRSFKRHFDMTFLDMARQRRLRDGFTTLSQGETVIAAQIDSGFESPSAFREAFSRLIGCAPGALKQGGLLQASWIATPLGDMLAVSSARHLHLLEFIDRKALPRELTVLQVALKSPLGLGRTEVTEQAREELDAYFSGRCARFETPLAPQGSTFTRRVHRALQAIPAGETRSYGELARAIGHPGAVRAVARANGANCIALMIPCHRVIGSDGSLTGYGGGLWRKQRLIEIEQEISISGTCSRS